MSERDVKLVWFIEHPSVRIWSVNPYKQCAIRCVYCIARPQGRAEPWFGSEQLAQELKTRLTDVPHDTELFVGALVDAYPPEEERLGLTRIVLAELSRQNRPFCINTTSTLVQRDVDILVRHEGHCEVLISLCCLDEDVISALEPNAPSVAKRLQAISSLHRAGVEASVDAAPWIPGLSDIGGLLERLPTGLHVQVAPLDIRHLGSKTQLMGKTFTQEQVNAEYQEHRAAVGANPRVMWKDVPF
jgi:DNA repair photolyase